MTTRQVDESTRPEAAAISRWHIPVPPEKPTSWDHDGAVVKEQSAPEVYVLFGGARFHIPSPEEMAALGISWSQVITVPDGALTPFARVPVAGTLVRDRTSPDVWLSVGSKLWRVPSPETMRFLNLSWARVHVVPAGSLNGLPQLRSPSAFPTPASAVFAPNPPERWARTDVPGVTLPNGVRLVELRGWIRAVDSGPNASDPDWHLQLEPDPEWLDALGVNWSTIFKVGDILAMGINPLTNDDDQHARAATPTFHIEVNGWQRDKHQGVAPPSDWTVAKAEGGQLDGVVWPYLPTVSGGHPGGEPLAPGQYVRVVGSLLHDISHCHAQGGGWSEFWEHNFGIGGGSGAYDSAAQDWEGAYGEFDEADPSRWTEIHPPDIIERLLDEHGHDKQPTEAVYGITVVARAAVTNPFGNDQEITVDLHPPTSRPPHTKAAIREYVGPETRYASIVEGNAHHNGAAITLFNDHASVHVKVHGDAFAGAPGKFKAVYRLTWVDDPRSYRLRVGVQPSPVPAGVSTTVTFTCVDADSGAPLAGTVSLDGLQLGPTNTPVTATFVANRKRVYAGGERGPNGKPVPGRWVWIEVPPTVTVTVPRYVPATLEVPLR